MVKCATCGGSAVRRFEADGQTFFQIFRQGEEEVCIASWARWNAQLKGLAELETLETNMCSHGAEGVDVDPEEEGRHERVQVKNSRRQSEAPEIKSPKRKIIEARKLTTVQEIMTRSTDYLRRIIAPAGRQEGVSMSYVCPHCNSFQMEDYVWWESTQIGGVRSVEKNMTGGNQTGSWWCKQVQSACSTSGPMWEFDQCVEVADEPTRGWRRPYTEYRHEPL